MMWIVYFIGFVAGFIAGLWTYHIIAKYRKAKEKSKTTEVIKSEEN